jgi:hypothetical protein
VLSPIGNKKLAIDIAAIIVPRQLRLLGGCSEIPILRSLGLCRFAAFSEAAKRSMRAHDAESPMVP